MIGVVQGGTHIGTEDVESTFLWRLICRVSIRKPWRGCASVAQDIHANHAEQLCRASNSMQQYNLYPLYFIFLQYIGDFPPKSLKDI
jgi:hypothetical protein